MNSYSDLLKDPRWQKRRLEIFHLDQYKCTRCGDGERQLHVHHSKYTGKPWEAPNEDLSTICTDCHWLEHNQDKFTPNEIRLIDFILVRNRVGGTERNANSMLNIKSLIILLKSFVNG